MSYFGTICRKSRPSWDKSVRTKGMVQKICVNLGTDEQTPYPPLEQKRFLQSVYTAELLIFLCVKRRRRI